VAHLPGAHEVGHRADGVLDGHGRVDAMLIVEVDVIDAEARERCVAGLADVLGIAANAERLT
jgi:hypothetical protein